MKSVTELTANPQELIAKASSNDQKTRSDDHSPSSREKRFVTALYHRMNQLYQHKWESVNGQILDVDRHSDNFLRWCASTKHLTNDQWAAGMARIERKIVADAANGGESWPPSDVVFVSYCKPSLSPSGTNKIAYVDIHSPEHPRNDPTSPEYCPKPKGLEDLTKKSARRQVGRDTLDSLKELF